MLEFHLDTRSGVPTYQQLVQQVKQALRLGLLAVGDQLPTVKEVVGKLAINPNTVLRAYRELEYENLVVSRPGSGTFVINTLAGPSPATHAALKNNLIRWLKEAHQAGLDQESIIAIFNTSLLELYRENIA